MRSAVTVWGWRGGPSAVKPGKQRGGTGVSPVNAIGKMPMLPGQRAYVLRCVRSSDSYRRLSEGSMETNPQILRGNWKAGWALDLHTVSSKARAEGEFETQRTEIGEALYQLKYRGDRGKIEPIAQAAVDFLEAKTELRDIEAILPVPPSDEDRPFQPVYELARAIARRLDLLLAPGYLIKIRRTKPLKELDDRGSRKQELEGAFRVKDARLAGKPVLLFDDLYRSGETLKEITHVLSSQGKVSDVFVLTITKTRTKK